MYIDYSGPGGIPVGGIWQKAAFALRFHDFNLLLSKEVTASSRIMYNQDVRTLVSNVAPFLQIDSNPYPVIDNGHVDWIVDAYTTTSYYPYSQSAAGTGLAGSFNYVRNSVKAVVDAYSGQVTLYAWDPSDPILQTWMNVFPDLFKPKTSMDSTLLQHLRYPQNLLSVEATMYGKYHVTSASSFYNNSAAWQVSLTGSGPSATTVQPDYQLLQLPGQAAPSFNAFIPLVPLGRVQTLTAFLVADCSASNYGALTAYEVPQQSAPNGPAIANGQISTNTSVSDDITLLDQHGSKCCVRADVADSDRRFPRVRPCAVRGLGQQPVSAARVHHCRLRRQHRRVAADRGRIADSAGTDRSPHGGDRPSDRLGRADGSDDRAREHRQGDQARERTRDGCLHRPRFRQPRSVRD